MQSPIDILQKKLKTIIPKGNKWFALVYGSHATGTQKRGSDLDLMVFVPKPTSKLYLKIRFLILEIHSAFSLGIDEEVPFQNKLLLSYAECQMAAQLMHFKKEQKVLVTPIKPTYSYLASKEMKLRLAYNVLTTPHFYLGNDRLSYSKLRAIAEENLLTLSQNCVINKICKNSNLVDALIGRGKYSEKLYLGYKNTLEIRRYLRKIINLQKSKQLLRA